MTGFARADGAAEGWRWTWELRSVNGKGLDLRLRLPPGFEAVEIAAREAAARHLTRGNVSATLTAAREGAGVSVRVNEAVIDAVVAALDRLKGRIDAAPLTLDGLLQVKGVLETVEPEETEESRTLRDRVVVESFEAALARLVTARAEEGRALAAVLGGHVDTIERLAAEAEALPSRRPETIRARLEEQVRALLDAAPQFDPARLAQEAALLATKADIREELDRLGAHVAQARRLLAEGAAVGRRLDFLAQEFNREVNTLCSKSNDTRQTAIGLDLKAVVDQFREQIQNVE